MSSTELSSTEFYLVQNTLGRQTFIAETELSDRGVAKAGLDRTVTMIAEGQFDTGEITAIYRCDPANRIMEDRTQAILEAVALALTRTETIPCESVARLLWQHGIGYAPHLMAAE